MTGLNLYVPFRQKALDVIERVGVTPFFAFVAVLTASGVFTTQGIVDVAIWGKIGLAGIVLILTVATSLIKAWKLPKLPALWDYALRVVLTFVQVFLSFLLANAFGLSDFANADTYGAALTAGLAAALSFLKGGLLMVAGSNKTASLLPAQDDPTIPLPAAA